MRETLVEMLAQPAQRLSNRSSTKAITEDFWALKELSFEIKAGEVLGIIGRNGAGKSTLLKILSQITKPTTGRATMTGRMGSLLEVGTGFHPELSGRENIFLNGAILGLTKAEIRNSFDAIVEFSGVSKFLDMPVKRYSSGMMVRLAFAVAAHLEPEILIIDEVLAVGDADFQKKCLGKMGQVARSGRTVLFVSHDMSAVASLTSRCIHLEAGRLRETGASSSVIGKYLDAVETSEACETEHSPRNRDDLGHKVRICRIRSKPKSPAGFQFGEPLIFTVDLMSNIEDPALRFGLTIRDIAGTGVMSTITPPVVNLRAGERRTFEIKLSDTRLAPGRYYISLSVGKGGLDRARAEYDLISAGPGLNVLATQSDKVAVAAWNREFGGVVHPTSNSFVSLRNVCD
jgi:lipopolysaccharide transport system ATP-binding protein